MSQTDKPRLVDESVIKVSQAATILFMLTAFIMDVWLLVAIVALINLAGAVIPSLSLWRQLYQRVLRPAGLVKPNILPDNPEPHRFAAAIGGTLAALSALALASGNAIVGWSLGWVLIILAGLNLFAGFCLGCFTYYQLNNLGAPGFSHSPIDGAEETAQERAD